MSAPRRTAPLAAVAVVLLLGGIAFAGLYRLAAGTENHSYSPGAVPPATAHLTAGHTYRIAVPGGVSALSAHHLSSTQLRCDLSATNVATQSLVLQPEGPDSKATDVVATFTAPYSGAARISCSGWGAVFVDDADDAGPDISGYLLLVCMALFLAGGLVGLAALRRHLGSDGGTGCPHDEVQGLVDVAHVPGEDGEIGGAHGRHVPA